MKLVKKTNDLFPRIPSFFDDFLGRDVSDWLTTSFPFRESMVPAANIKEAETEFIVDLAVPGMDKKDFNIELENDILTISSERKNEIEEKNEESNYFRREFSFHSFQRSFRVPENRVDVEKIEANYKDGVLHIKLPKLAEKVTKPTRQIKIS